MKKKYISIIVLVFALILLLLVYVVSNNKANIDGEKVETTVTQDKIITNYPINDIQSISFISKAEEDTYVRDGDSFSLADDDININSEYIKTVCAFLANFTISDSVTDDDTKFGISVDSDKLIVTIKNKPDMEVIFGNDSPDGKYSYVHVKDGTNDGIFMVEKVVSDVLRLSLNNTVDKSFAQIDFLTLNKIEIDEKDYQNLLLQKPKESIDMAENMHGISMLQMVSPYKGKNVYSQSMVETIFTTITTMKLNDLIEADSDDLGKYGIEQPFLNISIISDSGELNLEIGDKVPDKQGAETQYYCIKSGENDVFTILESDIAPFISVDCFKFMDKFVNLVPIDDLENLNIKTGDSSYDISKNIINGKNVSEADFNKFYTKIVGLEEVKALGEDFTPDKGIKNEFTFQLKDGSTEVSTFYVYDTFFDAYYDEVSEYWFLVSEDQIHEVFQNAQVLLQKK